MGFINRIQRFFKREKNVDDKVITKIDSQKEKFYILLTEFNKEKDAEYKKFLGYLLYKKYTVLSETSQNQIIIEKGEPLIGLLKKFSSEILAEIEMDKLKNSGRNKIYNFNLFERLGCTSVLFIDNDKNLYALNQTFSTNINSVYVFEKDNEVESIDITTNYGFIDGEYEFDHEKVEYYRDADILVFTKFVEDKTEEIDNIDGTTSIIHYPNKNLYNIIFNVSLKLVPFDSRYRAENDIKYYNQMKELDLISRKYNCKFQISDEEKSKIEEIYKQEQFE